MLITRVLGCYDRFLTTTENLRGMGAEEDHEKISRLKGLNSQLVEEVNNQALAQLGTCFFFVAVPVGLAYFSGGSSKLDTTPLIDKLGNVVTTFMRADETEIQGRSRIIEQDLTTRKEQSISELFDRYMKMLYEVLAAMRSAYMVK